MSKLMTISEAVRKYTHDGMEYASVALPVGVDSVAFAREMIKQGRKHITYDSHCTGTSMDMLAAEGSVDKWIGGFSGLEVFGFARGLRNAMEHDVPHHIEMDDYSNLGMCLRYIAGAFNWPFIPTNSNFGCDIQFKDGFNAEAEYPCKTKIPMIKDPFTGEDVAVLAPLKPELAVIHVTMADTEGNAGSFGSLWNHFELSRAAKKLVLEADYIVDSDCWRQYPNLAFIPDFLVAAVIPFQLGCWPQASPGIYDCDEEHFYYLNKMCSTQESWKEYKAKYIDGWKTHKEYMKVIGGEEVRKIMDTNTAFLMDPYRKWIKSDEEISELIGEDY